MDELVIVGRKGCLIRSVEEWFVAAPPKARDRQWKDGFSAKELAKAWFRTGVAAVPVELATLMETNPATEGARVTLGIAEHPTGFDSFRGGKRSHDLLLVARKDANQIAIGVEAKVAETLGSRLIGEYEAAKAAEARGKSTKLPARIEHLVLSLFGRTLDEDVGLGNVYYQLLTAAAGALVEARRRAAIAAVLVVHELIASRAPDVITTSQLAVGDFIAALDRTHEARPTMGMLHGPFTIPGGGMIPSDVPLFVGLARP